MLLISVQMIKSVGMKVSWLFDWETVEVFFVNHYLFHVYLIRLFIHQYALVYELL